MGYYVLKGGENVIVSEKGTLEVPDYLVKPTTKASHYYGRLSYNELERAWVINGEPAVVEMAKRLFPGCSGRGRGIARFKANKRTNGDLNWLMLRYPLHIEDAVQWQNAWEDTVHHVIEREKLNQLSQRVKPLSIHAKLRPFQEEGLAFLLQNRRTLLADDMGLGKTVQALAFLSETKEYPAMLVCQPHLINNIVKEIQRFIDVPTPPHDDAQTHSLDLDSTEDGLIHIIRGRKPHELPSASIYIVHYGLLSYWKDVLPKMGIQTLFFDEIQDLRHSNTQKYSAASLLADSAENVFGLSGTPIYNRGGEIWSIINILEYHALGDWESFTREWCSGYGSDIVQDPDLLGDYLRREGLMLRRRKEDVLSELPPKRRIVQTIDCDSGVFDSLIQGAVTKAMDIDGIKDHLEKGRITRDIVNTTRQATGVAKAPYVAQFVRMLMEAGETVLLFAYHHAVFDIYMKELATYSPGIITGRETLKEKAESERRFMGGETNLLMISLRASAGLNLQRARVVVAGELDWSPAIHNQAEDRAHRMGQEDSVLAYYLVSDTGSDEDVQEALGLKVSQFTGLMGDIPEKEEDKILNTIAVTEHMNNIVQRLQECGRNQHHSSRAGIV